MYRGKTVRARCARVSESARIAARKTQTSGNRQKAAVRVAKAARPMPPAPRSLFSAMRPPRENEIATRLRETATALRDQGRAGFAFKFGK